MLGAAVWAFGAKEGVHMEMERQVLVGSCRNKETRWTLISRPCRVSSTASNPCSLQICLEIALLQEQALFLNFFSQ